MSGGLLDHLTQAQAICAGMGLSFEEAQEIVKAAHEIEAETVAGVRAELEKSEEIPHFMSATPPTTIDGVIYGVDFTNKRPKVVTNGTL